MVSVTAKFNHPDSKQDITQVRLHGVPASLRELTEEISRSAASVIGGNDLVELFFIIRCHHVKASS